MVNVKLNFKDLKKPESCSECPLALYEYVDENSDRRTYCMLSGKAIKNWLISLKTDESCPIMSIEKIEEEA